MIKMFQIIEIIGRDRKSVEWSQRQQQWHRQGKINKAKRKDSHNCVHLYGCLNSCYHLLHHPFSLRSISFILFDLLWMCWCVCVCAMEGRCEKMTHKSREEIEERTIKRMTVTTKCVYKTIIYEYSTWDGLFIFFLFCFLVRALWTIHDDDDDGETNEREGRETKGWPRQYEKDERHFIYDGKVIILDVCVRLYCSI